MARGAKLSVSTITYSGIKDITAYLLAHDNVKHHFTHHANIKAVSPSIYLNYQLFAQAKG